MFKKALLLATAPCALAGAVHAADTLTFAPVPVPTDDAAKRAILASESVTINGESHAIGYHIIARSGDKIGDGVFGALFDKDGNPVLDADGNHEISNDNDFTSLLEVGDKVFMVNHFETRPAAMYLTELEQNADTGLLTPVSTKSIDFSEWGGLWVPCAGSVTPWNTHLGSEEYPPNARAVADAASMDDIDDYFEPMVRYFGVNPAEASVDEFKAVFKPYTFGYATEVAVSEAGETTVTKHYAMGRSAFELAKVMPDQKTVYYSDDGTNVGFYMFVADTAGDLTAGNLYAAKWEQTSADNGGSANLSWVALGHATHEEIAKAINDGVGFYDIFDTAEGDKDAGTCPDGFSAVNTTDGFECLKVKEGMETVASRLETRRYTGMMGGTTEFRKEEGITLDPDSKTLFVAMSEIARGMEDFGKKGKESNSYDAGSGNHVTLPYNKCGGVYALALGADGEIGSDWVAQDMTAIITGTPTEYAEGSEYAGNACDVDGIANPDNIAFLPGFNTLIIGEDTGSGHQNDAIWAMNMGDKSITRIQTTPYGSETTSPYWHHVGAWTYLTSVIQHPYGESDKDKLENPEDAMAYTGFVGPFPSLKK